MSARPEKPVWMAQEDYDRQYGSLGNQVNTSEKVERLEQQNKEPIIAEANGQTQTVN